MIQRIVVPIAPFVIAHQRQYQKNYIKHKNCHHYKNHCESKITNGCNQSYHDYDAGSSFSPNLYGIGASAVLFSVMMIYILNKAVKQMKQK